MSNQYFFTVIFNILPVITLFTLGYILKHVNFLKEKTIGDVKKIIVNIALPCVLFTAFSSLKMQLSFLPIIIIIFFLSFFLLFLGKWIARPLGFRESYFPFMTTGFEAGMIGYALFLSMYGTENLDKFALVDLGQVVFVFTIYMAFVQRQQNQGKAGSNLAKRLFSSPVILSILLGIITSLLKPYVTIRSSLFLGYVNETIQILANLTVPLICLVIGYELKFEKDGLLAAVKTIVARLVLTITAAFLVNAFIITRLFQLPDIYRKAVFTLFILPPPFVITVFISRKNTKEEAYITNTLSIHVLVTAVLFVIFNLWF